jgi:hypothetical protein
MMRKSRRILTGMVVALAAVFVPAAGAQLPTVDAQSPSTPTTSTPSVQVPSVEIPQTSLQTPQMQVPSVQLPPVQTPQLQVQAPRTQVPSVPGVDTRSVPGAGGAPSVGGGAGSGFGLAASGSPNAGDGALAPSSPRQRRAAARRANRRLRGARTREAELRKSARRLRGCLDALRRFERRVIVLRAGIGGAPRTRRQVARRLHVSVGRVRYAERSGIRGLRRADSEFGCGQLGHTSGATGPGVGLAVSAVGLSEPDFDPSGVAADRNQVAGETSSSDDSGGFDPRDIVRQVAGAGSADSHLLLVALPALSVIALMAVDALEEMGRRRGRHR